MTKANRNTSGNRSGGARNTGAAKGAAGMRKTATPARQAAAAKAKPAARQRTAAKTTTQRRGAREEGAPLRPIRKHQGRGEVIAAVAAASGVDRMIVDRVARGLAQTMTRHLIRGGSGRVEIPYLGAALWRGRQPAQKARRMASPILGGRIVTIKARRAVAAPRLRAHQRLREAVARG